jgi:hypothetical protein
MRVSITGDCTVARAEEIRAAILAALEGPGGLELDLGGVTAMDLSFCQILHAAMASCKAKGVSFTLAETLPGDQGSMAVFCGLPELAGLPQDTPGSKTEACR